VSINIGALTGFFQRRANSILSMRRDTLFGTPLWLAGLPDANDAPYAIGADETNGVQVSQPDGIGGFEWVVPADVGHLHDSTYVNVTGDTMTGDLLVPDEVYGVGWNASLEVPTKNAIYDKIEAFAAGAYTDEQTRDAMAATLVAGNNIDITVNDAGDTITIDVESLTSADLSDFTEAVQDAVGGVLADSSTIDFTYTDGSNQITASVIQAGLTLSSIGGAVTDAQVPNTITLDNITQITTRSHTSLSDIGTNTHAQIDTHLANTSNPHSVTKTQVGLGNVDNTADASKAFTAAQTTSGTFATARLGSGTANSSSYLRGDQTWDTIGIDELNDVAIASVAQGQLLTYDSGSWVNADPQQGVMTLDDRTHAYVAQFGTTGTGNTNFDTPGQVAIDSSGNIYVADTVNDRLKKHNSSGTYVTSITGLNNITGVCIDSSNNIYVNLEVGVSFTFLIRKYNSALALQWESPLAYSSVRHIATDGTTVFISGNNFIRNLDATAGVNGFAWGAAGSGDGQFSTPVAVATDGTYLYVVDQGNDRIQKFTKAGAYIAKWGHAGSDPGEFQTAVGIHYNSVTGTLYVTDSGRDDVQEFTTDGAFIGSFGSAGTGNGQFQSASGIASDVAGSSVWVADATQDRLQKFTRSVTSEEATRVALNPNDFIVSSTDGGETGYISLAHPPDTALSQFQDSLFRVTNNDDSSKQLAFETGGITTGTTRTLTVPDFDGTISTLAGTETFTNKTLTTPTIASLTNAQHDHEDAAGGGVLGPAALGVIGIYQDADYTGSNVNTAQKIFNESTNGAATVAGSTAYLLEAVIHLHTTGTTSHDTRLIFNAGTCTFTSMDYRIDTTLTATENFSTPSTGWVATAAETVIVGALAAATHCSILLKGQVRVNAGGTFIPQFRFSAAPGVAPVILRGSYLQLTPIGTNTTTTVGPWS
jgi:hypothetical protein